MVKILLAFAAVIAAVLMVFIVFRANPTAAYGQDEELVGAWRDRFSGFQYVFYSDGTGNRGIPDYRIDTFTWVTRGGYLNIDLDEEPAEENAIQFEQWFYAINGNILSMGSRQVGNTTFSLTRVE